jgi:hypothetical protein
VRGSEAKKKTKAARNVGKDASEAKPHRAPPKKMKGKRSESASVSGLRLRRDDAPGLRSPTGTASVSLVQHAAQFVTTAFATPSGPLSSCLAPSPSLRLFSAPPRPEPLDPRLHSGLWTLDPK